MPYYISEDNLECDGWAVEKEDGEVIGCHTDKQSAIDQMVAISIEEDIEPAGERLYKKKMKKVSKRELPDNYRPALAEDVPEGRACGNCIFFNETKQNEDGTEAWCEQWEEFVDGGYYCNAWEVKEEERQVNLAPPSYMRAAARRGLEYHQQGLSGDGLLPRTVREAREMAAGRVTEDKWRRMSAWIARHMVDLDAPKNNNPQASDYPGAGLVAHLLWGSGPSKSAAMRALKYAQGVVERLDAEENKKRWSGVNVMINQEEEPLNKVERRIKNDVDFELRIEPESSDGMRFTGYAAVFNSESEPLPFTERINPGAFSKSLRSRNEVKMFMNHNMDHVLASTRSKTLNLKEDSTGLLAEAVLPDTSVGRDLATLMKRGDVHSMSFGFSVPNGGDKWSPDGSVRELQEVRLHEVSIVTGFPAYEATTASVRSLDILSKRTSVDADQLADLMLKLEAGETLPAQEADLLLEVVTKLRDKTEEVKTDLENLDLKRKELDLLYKAI